VSSLKGFKDSTYQVTDVRKTLSLVWKNKNLRNILSASFLLSFFYSWMVIYTPLYLHKDIGFSWEEIGIIFFVMLLPFVIVQFPLGRLADKKWGEKEILSVGFITLAISTGVIFFIDSSGIILWAVILFITRLGASAIEIMCDTYFFKKVSGLEANIISFYRMAGPAGYVIGPLLATLILSLVSGDIRFLFLILGVIMLFGLKFSLSLKDTK
jgi:MFS family permease